MNMPQDYGRWGLVFLYSVAFVGLAYGLFRPASLRNWRSFIAYSAFVVAMFAERYGFPLTTYLLSSWLDTNFPAVKLFVHDVGHLWWQVATERGNLHRALQIAGFAFIVAGFVLLSNGWRVLYHALRRHPLANAGPYRRVRHPRSIGFVAIMFGLLLQRPTLLMLAMFSVLVAMDVRLAIVEKRDSKRRSAILGTR